MHSFTFQSEMDGRTVVVVSILLRIASEEVYVDIENDSVLSF